MLRNEWPGIRITEGKEHIRVQGVYIFIIINTGRVAALVGHKTMTLNTMECPWDSENVLAFLRAGKWIYPLVRSLSPIIISEENTIVMPDPFSVKQYIGIKLPEKMTLTEKKILQKFFYTFGYVKGHFKLYRGRSSSVDAENIFDQDQQMVKSPICISPRSGAGSHTKSKRHVSMRSSFMFSPPFDLQYKEDIVAKTLRKMETPTMRYRSKSINIPLCIRPWKAPLLRLYTIGPQDPVFVKISTIPASIKIHFLVYKALKLAVDELSKRREKRMNMGISANFDRRFDQELKDSQNFLNQVKAPIPIELEEDTDWAAIILDENIKKRNFEMVAYETREEIMPYVFQRKELDGALIVRHLIIQYTHSYYLFTTLITLSEIETFRQRKTVTERVAERCDHQIVPFTECYAE